MEKDLYAVMISLLENGPGQGRIEKLSQLLGNIQTLSKTDQATLLTRVNILIKQDKIALEFFQDIKLKGYFIGNLLTNYNDNIKNLINNAAGISKKYKERKYIKAMSQQFVQSFEKLEKNIKNFYKLQRNALKDQVDYHSGYVSRVTGRVESFSRNFYYFIAYNITSVNRFIRVYLTPNQVSLLIQSNQLVPFKELALQKKPPHMNEFFSDSALRESEVPMGMGLLDPNKNKSFVEEIRRDNADMHLQAITDDLILEYYLNVNKSIKDARELLRYLVISRNIYFSKKKFIRLRSEIDTLIDKAIIDLEKDADSIFKHHQAITNPTHPYWSQIELHYDLEQCISLMRNQLRRFAIFLSEYSLRNRHGYTIEYRRDSYNFTDPEHERIFRLSLLGEYLGIGVMNKYFTALTPDNTLKFQVSDKNNTDAHHVTLMTSFALSSQNQGSTNESKALFTFFSGLVNSYFLPKEGKYDVWSSCLYDSNSTNNLCMNDENSKNLRPVLEYIRGRDHCELVEYNEIFAKSPDIEQLEHRVRQALAYYKEKITRYLRSHIQATLKNIDQSFNFLTFFMQLIFHDTLDSSLLIRDAFEGLYSSHHVENYLLDSADRAFLDVHLQQAVLNRTNIIFQFLKDEIRSSEIYPRINNTQFLFEVVSLDYKLNKLTSIEVTPDVQKAYPLVLGEERTVYSNNSLAIYSQSTPYTPPFQSSASARLEPPLNGLLSVIYSYTQYLNLFAQPDLPTKKASEPAHKIAWNLDLDGNLMLARLVIGLWIKKDDVENISDLRKIHFSSDEFLQRKAKLFNRWKQVSYYLQHRALKSDLNDQHMYSVYRTLKKDFSRLQQCKTHTVDEKTLNDFETDTDDIVDLIPLYSKASDEYLKQIQVYRFALLRLIAMLPNEKHPRLTVKTILQLSKMLATTPGELITPLGSERRQTSYCALIGWAQSRHKARWKQLGMKIPDYTRYAADFENQYFSAAAL